MVGWYVVHSPTPQPAGVFWCLVRDGILGRVTKCSPDKSARYLFIPNRQQPAFGETSVDLSHRP